MRPLRSSGFTLIEMSIVLVIIALLIGGIAVGRSLIRNSQLQSAGSESAKYIQAITTFQDKYKALPGDFAEATNLWGAAHAAAATCKTTASTTEKKTCNGDGDGAIAAQSDYASDYYEQFRAWQHLANAGFVEGSFTGTATSGTYQYTIGTNIAASRLSGGGWKMLTITTYDIDNVAAAGAALSYSAGDTPPNLVLWLGSTYSSNLLMNGVMTPTEAMGLDQKYDDGLPLTGKIISQVNLGAGSSKCYSTPDDIYSAADHDSPSCVLVFKTGL